ncbi:DUF5317 domain-containing protein [Cytobacillus firmus]|uniref:DUF5317 domain-containing protein n=1 Tax=Cytobacillus firmus DS1 TaxID=1307436 RepID=W7KZL6_CYTFI|nr:DUF5317 domain-containing protein [Cytobacillus firmus]EWG11558.1 hypothetical protein PBF_08398 [Cytobacillus firmus DS1]
MIYFLLSAFVITLLMKKNPLSFFRNIEFQWPLLIIACFGIQIALAFITIKTEEKLEMILILTFSGIIAGLWKNRSIPGIKWIFTGAILNLFALLLNGGLMPVSKTSMELTGQADVSFDQDSRHQLMDEITITSILGDWIPLIKYVLSPGDLLVGIGIVLLITLNSSHLINTKDETA